MSNIWTPEAIQKNTNKILDKLINDMPYGCHLSRCSVTFDVIKVNCEDVLIPKIEAEYEED